MLRWPETHCTKPMEKRQKHSALASTLQIVLALALIPISAVSRASSSNAAQESVQQPDTDTVATLLPPDEDQPEVTCGGGNIRVEATNSGNNTSYTTLQLAFAAINA